MIRRLKQNEHGMIMVALIILMAVFTVIGLALLSYTTSQLSRTRTNVYTANAAQTAEAGIEQTLYQINENEAFSGYDTEQVFFDNATQGRGVFTTTISPTADSNAKIITSTGKVYSHSNPSKVVSTRKVKVTIVGTNSEGYSVQSGPGGLILSGSASITNSDVSVNGKITMSGSARIGTNAQPVKVNVAHIACPTGNTPGPTYPQLCTSGQPITLDWSTFIYGTVCATGQTNKGPAWGGNILPGNGGQGLLAGCVADPVEPLDYDRSGHLAAITTTGSASNSAYACSGADSKTWPKDLKLTGNVNLGGSCKLRITGNVYITGNLDLGGASVITVDNSVGTTRPVIMVDGKITVGGSARVLSNSSGTGVHFISFKSANPCTTATPACTTLSGNDLKTSQNLETVLVGGGANMPGMIFHAYWGKVTLNGSGNMGAAAGQTVDMSGAGTVTFGTKLSSGSRSWTVTSYQEWFD